MNTSSSTETSDKKLIIYYDWASQPSRAVIAFCKFNNIPFELSSVRVAQGMHRTKEYTEMVPVQQIPAIKEIDLKTGEEWNLFESHAIMRYLAKSRNCPDHWYPEDPVKRALVD